MEDKILAHSMTEVVAVTEDAAENSLTNLVDNLEDEDGIEILESDLGEIEEVEPTPEEVEQAFSQVLEMELRFKTFPRVFEYVMKYGPSALEILEPQEFDLSLNDVQVLINNLMIFMQRYAAAGAGGMVLVNPDEN